MQMFIILTLSQMQICMLALCFSKLLIQLKKKKYQILQNLVFINVYVIANMCNVALILVLLAYWVE